MKISRVKFSNQTFVRGILGFWNIRLKLCQNFKSVKKVDFQTRLERVFSHLAVVKQAPSFESC